MQPAPWWHVSETVVNNWQRLVSAEALSAPGPVDIEIETNSAKL